MERNRGAGLVILAHPQQETALVFSWEGQDWVVAAWVHWPARVNRHAQLGAA